MIVHTTFGVQKAVAAILLSGALLLAGVATVSAQTTSFTPPTGYYQDQSRPGIYYNPTTQLYYNPMTGQYSNLGPVGQASRDSSGNYILPSGYSQYGSTNYYYNSSSGYYYDPMTGFFSTTAPVSTGVTLDMARNYVAPGSGTGTGGTGSGGVFTPGVPNTGLGGEAASTLGLLALGGAVAIGSALYLRRRAA